MIKINRKELDKILELHMKWLQHEEGGERANLRYKDFSNLDLTNIYLSYTDLKGADLSNANLSHADLYLADLDGADLSNANLSHANLFTTDLKHADLSYVNLRNANVKGANLLCAKVHLAYSLQFKSIT